MKDDDDEEEEEEEEEESEESESHNFWINYTCLCWQHYKMRAPYFKTNYFKSPDGMELLDISIDL